MESELMENTGSPAWAAFNTVLSASSGFIAFISIGDVQAVGGLIATCVAITSGCFAIRYYYFATKEKRQAAREQKKLNRIILNKKQKS
jgi:hypothetical protein